MTYAPVAAGFLLAAMSYAVWRAFGPKKVERPGPHNNWRNQDGTRK